MLIFLLPPLDKQSHAVAACCPRKHADKFSRRCGRAGGGHQPRHQLGQLGTSRSPLPSAAERCRAPPERLEHLVWKNIYPATRNVPR